MSGQRIKDGLNCTMMANDLGFSHMILEYITNMRVLDAFGSKKDTLANVANLMK